MYSASSLTKYAFALFEYKIIPTQAASALKGGSSYLIFMEPEIITRLLGVRPDDHGAESVIN